MLKKPKVILFDWDNTLTGTWPLLHRALEKTFLKMGKTPWTLTEVKMRVGKSARDAFPQLFGDRWQEAVAFYHEVYAQERQAGVQTLPGAEELLQYLKQANILAGVVSNKMGPSLREEVTSLGWNHYFIAVVGSQDAAQDKPAADPVYLALQNTSFTPQEGVWFVGDTPTDMECAHQSGCIGIYYNEEVYEGQLELRHCPPHHSVTSHHQLIELLKRL